MANYNSNNSKRHIKGNYNHGSSTVAQSIFKLLVFIVVICLILKTKEKYERPIVLQNEVQHQEVNAFVKGDVEEEEEEQFFTNKPKSVLIVNAASVIGINLAKKLKSRGDRVIVADSFVPKDTIEKGLVDEWVSELQSAGVEIFRWDACSGLVLEKILSETEDLTHFVHLHQHHEPVMSTLACFSRAIDLVLKRKPALDFLYDSSQKDSSREAPYYPIAEHYHTKNNMIITGFNYNVLIGSGVNYGNFIYKMINHILKDTAAVLRVREETYVIDSIDHTATSLVHLVDLIKKKHRIYKIDSNEENTLTTTEALESLKQENVDTSKILVIKEDKKPCNDDHPDNRHYHKLHYQNNINLDFSKTKNDFRNWFQELSSSFLLKRDMDIDATDDEETQQAIRNWNMYGGGSGRSVIFSCYFNTKSDPQRGKKIQTDNFRYIKQWYNSLIKLELEAVIFYDGLSNEFIFQYETSKIKFVKTTLGPRSTNDERFFIYRDYLIRNPDIKAVMFTDISDVVFKMNPFNLMKIIGDRVYVGRDRGKSMASNLWLAHRVRQCFSKGGFDFAEIKRVQNQRQVYNAGVIGGYTASMMPLLEKLTYYLSKTPKKYNCNMPVFNYAVHLHFSYTVYTGFPLNSMFFAQEKDAPGIYILHK